MIKLVNCSIFDSGADVILHQVNCRGVMGSGVAKQIRDLYPEVYNAYLSFCSAFINKKNMLGHVQYVRTHDGKLVANLFAQENFGYSGKCYTDYDALRLCLEGVALYQQKKVIAIPYKIGCCRGGGDWRIVHTLIQEILENHNVLICKYNGR